MAKLKDLEKSTREYCIKNGIYVAKSMNKTTHRDLVGAEVLAYRINGYTFNQIGLLKGLSRERIRQIYYRFKERINNHE